MKKEKIVPTQWYSLTEITSLQAFPWLLNDTRSYRGLVARDAESNNHLKPLIYGKGKTKRYKFKGEHIINFVKMVERGQVTF